MRGLYAIVDNTPVPERSHLWLAEQYLQGGARILQLRMKGGPGNEVAVVARSIRALKKKYQFTFILNDQLSLAKELDVDGYHGGQDDPSPSVAREVLGAGKLIGYSSHSLLEAEQAVQQGADYVAFGAIFPSPLKGPGHPVQGVKKLSEVVSKIAVPVVAIGGIGRDNVQQVLATSVACVALISGLATAPQPAHEVEYYTRLFR